MSGAVRLRSGVIAVIDRSLRQLRVFDQNGAFLRASGREGEGPGEFRNINWLGRCGTDSLFVYDWSQGKMIVLNPEGDHVRDLRFESYKQGVPAQSFRCDREGSFAVVGRPETQELVGEGPYRPIAGVWISDHSGRTIFVVGHFPATERYRFATSDGPHPFGATLSVAIHRGRVYVGLGSEFAVRVFDTNGRELALLRWSGEPIAMNDDILEAAAEVDIAAVRGLLGGDVIENRRRSWYRLELPQTLPAYDRLIVDTSGSLWIRQLTDGFGGTTWMVFDGEFVLLGEVTGLPDGFEITDVGDDYVLGYLSGGFRTGADQVLLFDLERHP